MTRVRRDYWQAVASALVGLALVGTGLWLAVLSNPNRVSLSVADDQNIQFFAISGFACTLAGVGLFLYAVKGTSKGMPSRLRMAVNAGMGLGFALQLGGFLLPEVSRVPMQVGSTLILAGLAAFAWAGMHYSHGKGHSRWLGLLAIGGVPGLVVLILLPQRESHPMPNTHSR